MQMRIISAVMPIAALLFLGGCCDTKSDSAPASASANPAAPPAEKTADESPSAAGLAANKVGKPLAEWQKEDIEEALKKDGWKINGSTATKSAMLSIVVHAEKAGTKADVKYYKDGGPYWKKQLAKEGAVVHEADGDIIVGVVIKGDDKAAKQLLDTLVGA